MPERRPRAPAKYRAGLIGAGYISEYHIAALRRLPEVEIVGVCDVNAARAAATAERFGLKIFPTLAALREAGADVIHVLTPPHTHAQITLDALDLGCHVLVEKPLAEEVEDCRRIERAAAAKGLRVCVNHSLLFDPQVRRALQAVRSGKLGRVVSVDILRSSAYPPYGGGALPPQYRAAGYPFRDLGVHALYLFEALLGPIEHVHADWKSLGGDPNLAYDEWRAQVRCREGLGQFQLSWNTRPLQSQIIIQGTKGVLRVDLFLMFNALRAATPLPKAAERIVNALTDSLQPMVDVPRGVYGFLRKQVLPYHGLQDLVAVFYRSLDAGTSVPVSAADAERVVRWTEEVARAADREHCERVARLTVSESVPYLVTGASGGLGSAIVERLRAGGERVRLLVRRVPDRVPDGTEVVVGDLGNPEAVDRAVRGAQVVIHAGAAMRGGWTAHEGATVGGTRNVLEACAKHGVQQLVHISSLSVVDWSGGPTGDPISEATPFEPRPIERGHYTRAKLAAEQLVTEFSRRHSVPAVILRPGQIFGGRIPLLTPAVARRKGRRWLVLGDGELLLPLIHIDDVVDAVVSAVQSDLREGQVVQLVHPESLTQNEVLRLVLGRAARITHVPRPLVFTLGWLSEVGLGLLGRTSPLSRYRLRSALSRRTFASTETALLRGWTPRISVRQAIRSTGIAGGTRNSTAEDAADEPGAIQSSESPRSSSGRANDVALGPVAIPA